MTSAVSRYVHGEKRGVFLARLAIAVSVVDVGVILVLQLSNTLKVRWDIPPWWAFSEQVIWWGYGFQLTIVIIVALSARRALGSWRADYAAIVAVVVLAGRIVLVLFVAAPFRSDYYRIRQTDAVMLSLAENLQQYCVDTGRFPEESPKLEATGDVARDGWGFKIEYAVAKDGLSCATKVVGMPRYFGDSYEFFDLVMIEGEQQCARETILE